MRIGVVSDTHDRRSNVEQIVELFRQARVDRVVHTGDITRPETLELFARLGRPLVGVFGNNDLDRPRLEEVAAHLGFDLAETLELDWAGRTVVVVHDPEEADGRRLADADVFLHGHTHRRRLLRRGGRLELNPGECAGHLPGRNTVATLDLANLEVELLSF